jgi:hypothetical protein
MRIGALLMLFVLCCAPLLLQGQDARPGLSIAGDVQDPSGAAIVGAEVTLLASSGEQIASKTSDNSGAFQFGNLRAGAYQIIVSQSGFQQFRQKIEVTSTSHVRLHIAMTLASTREEVTVEASSSSAQVSTEISDNQSSNTIERDALDRLPVFDQDYITAMSRFLNPDATGTNGVTLVVNGVEANGPGVTASAVQSVKINQNPYTALYSRPGRARVEITTKGGTPKFHGSANFLYRDSLFDARNGFAIVKPTEQRTYFEGSMTGPLRPGAKTTFLLSLDKDNDNQEAIVVAAGPSGVINANIPNPTRHYFLSGRAFHDYGHANQVWIGYSFEHRSVQNQGIGGTTLPEAGSDFLFYENEINVGHVYVFSPRLLNQLRFLVGDNQNRTTSLEENPQLIVSGSFTGGGAQADLERTENHFDGTDIVTYTTTRQEIKFGVDVPDISRRAYDDFTYRGGSYSFASLAQYTAGQPFSFLVQSGQGRVTFVERTVAGIFEDTFRLRPNLSIAAGARYYWQNYFHDIAHNLAPRLSFAYSPLPSTVMRGGAGFFFDRSGPSPIADLMHYNGVRVQRIILENPQYPVTESALEGQPTGVVVLDPRQRIPYTIQYGVGIERQVTAKSSVAANYVGTRGIDLFRSVDVNAPLPPAYTARPNSAIGQERQLQSEGYQKSNSLEVIFRGRPTSFLTGQAQYSLGKSYNNTSGITFFPANSNFPDADWSRSDNDQRNRFDLLGSLEAGRWLEFGTAVGLYSGKPVDVTTGNDGNHDSLPLDRPAGVPRNSLHGPGYIDLDFDLGHDFSLTKARKDGPVATLSLNAFNALNHKNDVTYIGVIGSRFFGQAVAAQPARRMQLNFELKF